MWPRLTFKELIVNAWDFLNDFYPSHIDGGQHGKDERWISVTVTIDDVPGHHDIEFIRISVCNSNIASVKVFKHLKQTFDYDIWGSTKRGQHRGTGGALGDYLKRVLGMGYALWSSSSNIVTNDNDSREDIQWTEPIVLRFNKQEYRAFIKVDKDIGNVYADFEGPYKSDSADYIEVCATLPMPLSIVQLNSPTDSIVEDIRSEFYVFQLGKTIYTKFDFKINMNGELTRQ